MQSGLYSYPQQCIDSHSVRLDHERQSISLIAKRLCQLPQDASASVRRQCFDRIRKAANNYYKLLGSDYTALTSVRVRERIIRVPGNPSAVKSE